MGRDLGIGILLFTLAGLLFLLPSNLLRDCRLQIYSLWSESEKETDKLSRTPAQLTPVVAPEVRLHEITLQLIQKDNEIAGLRRELHNLGALRTLLPLTQIIPARILGFGGNHETPEVYLSAGTAEGVGEDYLLAQGTAFAGLIVNTGEHSSLALLPTHPGCVVGGRTAQTRDICSVRGTNAGKTLAVFYTGQTAAAPGEKILTSGLTGKAPEGLIIGTLLDYPHRGSEPGTLEAPIRLEVNLNQLENVLILSGRNAPTRSTGVQITVPVTPVTPASPTQPTTPAKPGVPSVPTEPAEDEVSPALG